MMNPCLSEIEEWRTIPGYEGEYEASSLGRIRTTEGKTTSSARYSKRVWKQRILKQKWGNRRSGKRDARVTLWHNGEEKTLLVARCVCMAFYPDADFEHLTVNHISGDTEDNTIRNLEWLSQRENIRHAFRTGLMPSVKHITITDADGNNYDFDSLAKASKFLGHGTGYVSGRIKNGYTTLYSNDKRPYSFTERS